MSYTRITYLNNIIGKNILFLDLETSGLVKTKSNIKPEFKYPEYSSSEYNETRIISIGYCLINNFNYAKLETYMEKDLCEFLVKPTDFKITNDDIHGITQEYAEKMEKI